MSSSYEQQSRVAEQLRQATEDLRSAGREAAETEYAYRVALAKFIGGERLDGTPVTIIGDLARGDEKVARLRRDRDIARTRYEAIKEVIYTKRLELKIARGEAAEDRRGM